MGLTGNPGAGFYTDDLAAKFVRPALQIRDFFDTCSVNIFWYHHGVTQWFVPGSDEFETILVFLNVFAVTFWVGGEIEVCIILANGSIGWSHIGKRQFDVITLFFENMFP